MTKEGFEAEKELETAESGELSADIQEKDIGALEEEIAKLQAENQKNQDLHLRALAEQENIKKRAAREREEYIRFSTLPLINKLLLVTDDLDRALGVSLANQDLEAFKKGVEMIARKLQDLIKNEGVKEIEAVGKPFDPAYHQPLMVEGNGNDEQENIVVEEFQKGYIMHGRVIRPSLVKVSKE